MFISQLLTAVKEDTTEIKAETSAIKKDTSGIPSIKQDTVQIASLIEEIGLLRMQVSDPRREDSNGGILLQRFLDESTTYAESAVDSTELESTQVDEAPPEDIGEDEESGSKTPSHIVAIPPVHPEVVSNRSSEKMRFSPLPPVHFTDAVGRNYNFPFEVCWRWRDMERLITQAFQHIEDLAEHVRDGHYALLGPDRDIIMPQQWDGIVKPDMHITMELWPLPEPKKDEDLEHVPPPIDEDVIIDLDAIPRDGSGRDGGGRRREKDKDRSRKKRGTSGALGMWMLGGSPGPSRYKLKR